MQSTARQNEEVVALPLADRIPLFAMLSANAISGAGNAISRLAIPWFVLETTGSAARTGLVGAVEVLPLVIAGVFGGTLVDRFGLRRMSIMSDIASGATVAIIPALYYTLGLEFWQLLALVFAGALLDAPGQTARRSILPELAGAARMPLARANGYFGAISRSTGLIGPPAAGVLIALIGAAPLLWINAATFGISALLMLTFVPASIEPDAESADLPASYLSDLLDGFNWIRQNAVIRTFVVMILITNFIESPLLIVLTVYARDVLQSAIALGFLLGAFSIGAIAGSMLAATVAERFPTHLIFPFGFSAIILLYGVLILEAPYLLLVVAAVLTGVAAGPLNPVMDTIFQLRIPPQMRGRVFGLRAALMMSATPLGILAGGALIGAAGIRVTLLVQAVAMASAVAWMLISPTLREVDGDGSQALGT